MGGKIIFLIASISICAVLSQHYQQDQGYNTQNSYHPQPNSYHPQPNSYHPQPNSYQPQHNSYQPQHNSYQPQPNSYQPQPNSYQPQPNSYQPQPNSYQPQPKYERQYEPVDPYNPGYGDSYKGVKKISAYSSKDHYEQYWDNLELCNANYKLSECLMDCTSKKDFYSERRIIRCALDSIRGLCSKVRKSKTGRCDLGYVKLDKDTCETSAFANTLLVFNDLVRDLDTVLSVTPTFDEWSYTTITLSIATIRRNADCVIHAFLNYLDQCAANKYISHHDIQCVEDHLDHASCEFAAETGVGWNLPELIMRYGEVGARKVMYKLKHAYHYSDAYQVRKAYEKVVDAVGNASNFVLPIPTEFDLSLQEASTDVCPVFENNINTHDGAAVEYGQLIDDLEFHFPSNETFTNSDGEEIDVDPTTNYHEIYDTCKDYYETTKAIYETNDGETTPDRCFSISGYYLKVVETGERRPMHYKVKEDSTSCYTASWAETQTCSTHLTEWIMQVACCKSYSTILDQITDKHEEKLAIKNRHYYHNNQIYHHPDKHRDYYPMNNILIDEHSSDDSEGHTHHVAVSSKDLFYEYDVKSNTTNGVLHLHSIDQVADIEGIDNVIYKTNEWILKWQDRCEDMNLDEKREIYERTKYGNKIVALCDAVNNTNLSGPVDLPHRLVFEESTTILPETTAPPTTAPPATTAPRTTASPHKTLLLSEEMETVQNSVYKHSHHKYYPHYRHHHYHDIEDVNIKLHLTGTAPYIGNSYYSKSVCKSLNIDLDFDTIIPVTSGSCMPQACVLSQLANCMDVPDKVYGKNYGYDYVTKNSYGYDNGYGGHTKGYGGHAKGYGGHAKGYGGHGNGYGNEYGGHAKGYEGHGNGYGNEYGAKSSGYGAQPSGYHQQNGYGEPQYSHHYGPVYHAFLSVQSRSSGLAIYSTVGFVAGIVVVAVAQFALRKRQRNQAEVL